MIYMCTTSYLCLGETGTWSSSWKLKVSWNVSKTVQNCSQTSKANKYIQGNPEAITRTDSKQAHTG